MLALGRGSPLPTRLEECGIELFGVDFGCQLRVVKVGRFARANILGCFGVSLQEEGTAVCCSDKGTQGVCIETDAQLIYREPAGLGRGRVVERPNGAVFKRRFG